VTSIISTNAHAVDQTVGPTGAESRLSKLRNALFIFMHKPDESGSQSKFVAEDKIMREIIPDHGFKFKLQPSVVDKDGQDDVSDEFADDRGACRHRCSEGSWG